MDKKLYAAFLQADLLMTKTKNTAGSKLCCTVTHSLLRWHSDPFTGKDGFPTGTWSLRRRPKHEIQRTHCVGGKAAPCHSICLNNLDLQLTLSNSSWCSRVLLKPQISLAATQADSSSAHTYLAPRPLPESHWWQHSVCLLRDLVRECRCVGHYQFFPVSAFSVEGLFVGLWEVVGIICVGEILMKKKRCVFKCYKYPLCLFSNLFHTWDEPSGGPLLSCLTK